MSIFRFLSSKPTNERTSQQVDFIDEFADNSNGWVEEEINNPSLIQQIKNGMLYLESNINELGVSSTMSFKLDESKDFEIEAKVKIQTEAEDCNVTLDFGISQNSRGHRVVGGQEVNTTWGATNYYFGYSDSNEFLIAKWEEGKETYYSRGHNDSLNTGGFNIIRISKVSKITKYFINDEQVFEHPHRKLFGAGLGFSSSPNSKLWVDYIKITN